MLLSIFERDKGDGAGADPTPAPGSPEPKVTPELGDGDKGVQATPDTPPADWMKQLTERDAKIKNLESTVGKQGNELSIVKRIKDGMAKKDPGLLTSLAKEMGVNIKLDDGSPEPKNVFDKEEDDVRLKGMADEIIGLKNELNQMKSGVGQASNAIMEQVFANNYKDWDEYTDARGTLDAVVKSGEMSMAEVYHNAARGFNLPEILKAHEEEVTKKIYDDLDRKNQGLIEAGRRPASKGDTASWENVVKSLNK